MSPGVAKHKQLFFGVFLIFIEVSVVNPSIYFCQTVSFCGFFMDSFVNTINFFIRGANFAINTSIIVLRLLILCWNICGPFTCTAILSYVVYKLDAYRKREKRVANAVLDEVLNTLFRMNVAEFRAESINITTTVAAA
ncbi:MAG: hypothetical protein Q8M03_08415 [Legionella sp.]|nr:hypothetical protein [Legionella sp.]